MAENNPIVPPAAPVPPKPPEAAKVQPKKETVRIALPPKPSASPTIKLPSIPAGGSAVGAAAPAAPVATTAPAAAGPAVMSVPARPVGAPPPPPKPPASAGVAMAKPAAAKEGTKAPVVKKDKQAVSQLDVALAMVAAFVGLAAVVSLLAIMFGPFAMK